MKIVRTATRPDGFCNEQSLESSFQRDERRKIKTLFNNVE